METPNPIPSDILVERVREDFSHENNTANHPKEPNDTEIADLDYETELDKTRLSNYNYVIDYPVAWMYTFTADERQTLLECATVGMKVGNARLFADELAPILARFETHFVAQSGGPNSLTKWFFRMDSSSPKDGNPVFPIMSAGDALNKLVTSKRAWQSLLRGDRILYFVPYESNWDQRREFRVFIYKRRITAISQYHSYDKGMLSGKSNIYAREIAARIIAHLESTVSRVCEAIGTDNVTCDVYVRADNDIRIIEFNSFGYWLAAGSALFHWLRDRKKLYNSDGKIYLRFVK